MAYRSLLILSFTSCKYTYIRHHTSPLALSNLRNTIMYFFNLRNPALLQELCNLACYSSQLTLKPWLHSHCIHWLDGGWDYRKKSTYPRNTSQNIAYLRKPRTELQPTSQVHWAIANRMHYKLRDNCKQLILLSTIPLNFSYLTSQ